MKKIFSAATLSLLAKAISLKADDNEDGIVPAVELA